MELFKNKGYKVLTPDGYKDFAGIAYMGEREVFVTNLEDGFMIETTADHPVFTESGKTEVSKLTPDTLVKTSEGLKKVLSVFSTGRTEKVYDLIEVNGGHRFYTNNVLVSNCEFVSEDDTLIDSLVLARLRPEKEVFLIDNSRWFTEPKPNHVYGIGWDPAMGSLRDFSCIQVIDFTDMEQVAEWRSNQVPIKAQLEMLLKMSYYIYQTLANDDEQLDEPEIFWSFENNGIGAGAISELEHLGEENIPGIFISEPIKRGSTRTKGLRTTTSSKMAACAFLKKVIENDSLKVKSRPLIREMKNFVRGGGSYAAKSGEHDDLIMGLIITLRVLMVAREWSDNINTEMDGTNPLEDLVIEPMPFIAD